MAEEIKIKSARNFIILIIVFAVISIASIYSASFTVGERFFKNGNYFFIRQIIWYTAGSISMIIFSKINYNIYRKYALHIYVLGISMLLAVEFFGTSVKGATRWIKIGGLSVQPAEFSKIIFVIFIAVMIEKFRISKKSDTDMFVKIILSLGAYMLLIIRERDFGTCVQLTIITLLLFFIINLKKKYFFIMGIAVITSGTYAIIKSPHRIVRIKSYLSGMSGGEMGHQLEQSVLGMGNGGFFGLGYGNGIQKYYYLPEPHTDFIFSVIGEEGGFIMSVIIVILFFILTKIGISVAMKKKDYLGKLLAFGITTMFAVQAVINLYVVTGMAPTKGMPMPFISFGGSALITTMVASGILLNIMKEVEKE
jgi:cell division protein FtsW